MHYIQLDFLAGKLQCQSYDISVACALGTVSPSVAYNMTGGLLVAPCDTNQAGEAGSNVEQSWV